MKASTAIERLAALTKDCPCCQGNRYHPAEGYKLDLYIPPEALIECDECEGTGKVPLLPMLQPEYDFVSGVEIPKQPTLDLAVKCIKQCYDWFEIDIAYNVKVKRNLMTLQYGYNDDKYWHNVDVTYCEGHEAEAAFELLEEALNSLGITP